MTHRLAEDDPDNHRQKNADRKNDPTMGWVGVLECWSVGVQKFQLSTTEAFSGLNVEGVLPNSRVGKRR